MKNVKSEFRGDRLVLTIDTSEEAYKQAKVSSTGKTKLLATTNGFVVFRNIKLSLNATTRKAA